MKLTQEQAEQVVAYAQSLVGEEVEISIADVVEAVSSYDAAAQQWISATFVGIRTLCAVDISTMPPASVRARV